MSPKPPTPANPVTGPARPPGFTGLRRWTDIRVAIPLLLIGAFAWSVTHPMAPSVAARTVADTSATVVDTADLVARTPAPTPTLPPTPKPAPTATPLPTIAVPDVNLTDVQPPQQPAAAVAAVPAAPPTPSAAADIARQKRADAERAALDAPLIAVPIRPQPVPSGSPADDDGSGYWLRRGMVITATLYTSIDSTVAGPIVAYVADDVYDFTHTVLVIPRHAKLFGSFGVRGVAGATGQARIPASFDEIQLADRVVPLSDEPGIDRTGTTGLGARVDRHTRATFESFAILASAALLAHSNSCTNCEQSGSGNVGSTLVTAGTPLLPQPNAIQPTSHAVEGEPIAIMLTHDIRVRAWTP